MLNYHDMAIDYRLISGIIYATYDLCHIKHIIRNEATLYIKQQCKINNVIKREIPIEYFLFITNQ